jgi:hypothetical protein
MTVVLRLEPEIGRRLQDAAAARGVSVEAYVTELIKRSERAPAPVGGNLEEFEADMDAIAAGCEELPVLPEGAFTRERIYADHD